MTEYATEWVQEDGFYRYSFRADSSGDTGRAEVLIEAVDPESAGQLADEAARAEQAAGALRNGSGFPRTLARYTPLGTSADSGLTRLVLHVPGVRGKGGIFFLEPALQENPGLLPAGPKMVRRIAVDVYGALAALHRTGYAHGAVNTSSLLWNRREAVLARYHRTVPDPDGQQRSKDVADAARLLYHVAIGKPLNGALTPEARRELNRRLHRLGDLLTAALDPPGQRISALEALETANDLSVPNSGPSHPTRTPAQAREDTEDEARARQTFQDIRARHRDVRRRRCPTRSDGDQERFREVVVSDEELPPLSPLGVLRNEGVAAAVRQLSGRFRRWGAGARWLTVGGAAVVMIVLGALLGRML